MCCSVLQYFVGLNKNLNLCCVSCHDTTTTGAFVSVFYFLQMGANNTTGSFANDNTSSLTYIDYVLFTISVLGAVSNLLLLIAFIVDPLKCFRNSGTYLVMNLAVADCLTCVLFTFAHIDQNDLLIFHFFLLWFQSVSFLSITSVSIDRFLLVAYPIKHRILIKGKVLVLWLAIIWTVSCVIPALAMFSDISKTSGYNAFYTFTVLVILPSAVMYSSTYYNLKKQSRNIATVNSTEGRAQEMRTLKEKRFLNTIIIIAVIAFVFTVPSMVFFPFAELAKIDFRIPAVLMAFMLYSYMFQVSFAVNPFIYVLRLPTYRKTLYSLYCRRGTASS